jgi:LPXTG-site transpeptidase (sortase) family protein
MQKGIAAKTIRIIIFFLYLMFLIFSPFPTKTTAAAGITVDTESDAIAENGLCSLREAIINANSGDQIHDDCLTGTSGQNLIILGKDVETITLVDGILPLITSAIIIQGSSPASTVLQASTCDPIASACPHQHPLLTVTQTGNLTLQGLTIRHGNFVNITQEIINILGLAGGINNYGKLSLENCNVNRNRGIIGGGIINTGELTIVESNISHNVAEFGGGVLSGNILTIKGSHISHNQAIRFGGGLSNTQFDLKIMNNNEVLIEITPKNKITTDIRNTTISQNETEFGGGGILNDGQLSVSIGFGIASKSEPKIEITAEMQDSLNINMPPFIMKISECTISGNSASLGAGISNTHNFEIAASTLLGNQASQQGGGIYIYNGSTKVYNTTLSGNTASDLGGGIYTHQGALILVQNTLAGNVATGIRVRSTPISVLQANGLSEVNGYGGGIYGSSDSTISMSNTIIGNSSGGDCSLNHNALNRSENNLVEDGSCDAMVDSDPRLWALSDNGGATKTHALQTSSPAKDKGDTTICSSAPINGKDQRGEARIPTACDIGAFELYEPTVLPETGFTKGETTYLSQQPAFKAYAKTDLSIEIPSLEKHIPIVGVPQTNKTWDVTWLGNTAGYLDGSAFPTWPGNTVITGHVWNADDSPGIFADLKRLRYGDQVIINAFGMRYIYEVREIHVVGTGDIASVFQHNKLDWVTLVTCESYNSVQDQFNLRRLVRAVLVKIE